MYFKNNFKFVDNYLCLNGNIKGNDRVYVRLSEK